MNTKKELNKMNKKKLVDYTYTAQRFVWMIDRVVTHDLPQDILKVILQDAYDGKIDKSEFWGALRYVTKYEKKLLKELNEINEFEDFKQFKDKYGVAGFYKNIDFPKEKDDES